MSPNPNLTFDADRGRDVADRVVTFVRSNSSVVGAVLVIAGLFVAQRYVGAWLTDAAVIDEADIVPASFVLPASDDDETNCEPWVPTFVDEFEGDEIDSDRWLVFNSPDRNGNGVRRPEAITVEDGSLVLTGAVIEDEVVSGAVASQHQQLHGRFEARVRTDADPSETMSGKVITWPAGNNHPEGGQNDLYDTLNTAGREPFYSYIHRPDSSPQEIVHNADGEDWHEIAMEWTPDAITIHRDGELVGTVSDATAIPAVPHVVTLQLIADRAEMDGEPVRMYVDWVRVHRANDPLPDGC